MADTHDVATTPADSRQEPPARRRRRRRFRLLPRRRGADDGAVLVEFVMVFPLLWILLSAVIEFGWWIHVHNVVDQAARAGVRTAAIDGASSDDVTSAVLDTIEGGGLRTSRVEVEVSFGGNLVDSGTTLGLTCVLEEAQIIEVRVLYDHQPIMASSRSPLFGVIGDAVTGVDTGASLPAETYWRSGASGPNLSTGPVICP